MVKKHESRSYKFFKTREEVVWYAMIDPVKMVITGKSDQLYKDDLGGKFYGIESNVGLGVIDSLHNLLLLVGIKRLFL